MSIVLPPPPEFGAPVDQSPSPEVLRFLALRRSNSAVTLTGAGPTDEELDDLLRLAARVPDHGKLSPWRFVVLSGEDKAAFAARLDALAQARGDLSQATKLGKLKTPPLAVAVIFTPREAAIPEWEQILSAGAVCVNLLYAAKALGYGANWITDWYAYDPDARAILGVADREQVAGFILIGQARELPFERERPDVAALTTRWTYKASL